MKNIVSRNGIDRYNGVQCGLKKLKQVLFGLFEHTNRLKNKKKMMNY